jgi:hypothetical protein
MRLLVERKNVSGSILSAIGVAAGTILSSETPVTMGSSWVIRKEDESEDITSDANTYMLVAPARAQFTVPWFLCGDSARARSFHQACGASKTEEAAGMVEAAILANGSVL